MPVMCYIHPPALLYKQRIHGLDSAIRIRGRYFSWHENTTIHPNNFVPSQLHIKQNVRFTSHDGDNFAVLSHHFCLASLQISFQCLPQEKLAKICFSFFFFPKENFRSPKKARPGPQALSITSLWSSTFLAITINPWRYIETSMASFSRGCGRSVTWGCQMLIRYDSWFGQLVV